MRKTFSLRTTALSCTTAITLLLLTAGADASASTLGMSNANASTTIYYNKVKPYYGKTTGFHLKDINCKDKTHPKLVFNPDGNVGPVYEQDACGDRYVTKAILFHKVQLRYGSTIVNTFTVPK